MSTWENRLAVDDLVAFIQQNGTFQLGRIPIQNSLGIHRSKAKCHDRAADDLASDRLFKNILVKLYPNDGPPSDLLPKDLAILDRNLKIGQLVKKKGVGITVNGAKVGYVSEIIQRVSAKIYDPDIEKQSNPLRELYLYNKPSANFLETSKHSSLEIGDIVTMADWVGPVTSVIRNVAIDVEFLNKTKQPAHITQLDLLVCLLKAGVSTMTTHEDSVSDFGINGLEGIFEGRRCEVPYKDLETGTNSFRWSGHSVPKPANKSELVNVLVTSVALHSVIVNWMHRINQNANSAKPGANIKNDVARQLIHIVSHAKPLKVGDIRLVNMSNDEWKTALGIHAWRSCLAKDNFLHKRRDKRPKLDEDAKEILPATLPKKVIVEIMTTSSRVTVLWTDGTTGEGLDSRELDPVRYTKLFPGAIIFTNPAGVNGTFRDFTGLGPLLTRIVDYHVVESSAIKMTNFKDRSTWSVRNYRLGVGAVEPTVHEVSTLDAYKNPIPTFSFWKENTPQVVLKRRNSNAAFLFGCVIGMFPDGRVRMKKETGEIISVWPTDLLPMNPQWLKTSRSIFDGVRF